MLRKKKPKRDSGTRPKVKNPRAPARDEKHLAKVRQEACYVAGRWDACEGGSEAHHVRCLGPRSMGVRKSDYLTVPLCRWHHIGLHRSKEETFWNFYNAEPADFIWGFSPEGKAAIEALTSNRTAK